METVLERVKRVIADVLAVSEESIVAEASLVEDLGADSLDLVNLTFAVEEEFSNGERVLKIPEEVAEEIQTVQQIVDFIKQTGIN